MPMLAARGHEVIVLSRGRRRPYQPGGGWSRVRMVEADRAAEESAGTFGERVASFGADVVVDLICFTEDLSLIHI